MAGMEDTREEIHRVGHRAFVGGADEYWDIIGDLQFRFLVERGLKPTDLFIDVACGSLRGGAKFIRYLEPACYLGIDKYIELIVYGVSAELGQDLYREKRPRFVASDSFEFEKFEIKPAYGLAQSLFTHLCTADVERCLSKLRAAAAPQCRLFATFFEVDEPIANPAFSHSHGYYGYTRAEMEKLGALAGWTSHYIGEWKHPREQRMIEYIAS
jgi:hypothetical protein